MRPSLPRVAQRYEAGELLEVNGFGANEFTKAIISKFANMAMRTISLTYKDVGRGF